MSHIVRTSLWLSFFAVILLSWWMMYAMAMMAGLDWIGRPSGEAPEMALQMGAPGFGALFGMWAAMMAAMMLPTMVPTLRAYEDVMHSAPAAQATRAGWSAVLLGYFLVWVGFAAAIAGLQILLMGLGVVDTLGIPAAPWIAGLLLILVGAFQFTRTKEICHGICHSPTSYFLTRWRPGAGGGLRMGLGLGAFCVGCCWGFMVLGFVGGVMSLLWMGLATLFMVIEKLPQVGHYVTRPMGVILVGAGAAVLIWPLIKGVI